MSYNRDTIKNIIWIFYFLPNLDINIQVILINKT